MMQWFLVVASVAFYSVEPGHYIGPLTEESCRAAETALHDSPSAIGAQCRRAIGMRICAAPGRQDIGMVCPIFEGEMVTVGKH